ncbi:hypothetical protein LJC40_01265 [Synergistaceae bacterium OttesenSCG-928-D05]|nr:hypothetical protein [Synergistaceae bacterium OttesenSCG-928-D05]
MKLKTAKRFFAFSKILLCAALLLLVLFAALYAMGKIEFKYISLPVMLCFIGLTWMASTKAAVHVMEQEGETE